MFFFKKKKIVVDCFTYDNSVYEYYPIVKSIKTTPKWWNELPNKVTRQSSNGINLPGPTMKMCNGFLDLHKKTYTLPLWSDLAIKTEQDGSWKYQFSLHTGVNIESHNRNQFGNEFDDLIHLKITPPWLFREKTGVQFYFGDPFWSRIKKLNMWYIPPGIIDYKYHGTTNVNMFLNKVDQEFIIEAGQPLGFILPLSDHDVEIKNQLVSPLEFEKMQALQRPSSFINPLKKHKKIIDSKSKCPFGFK